MLYRWPSGLVSRSWFTPQDYTSTLTPTQPSFLHPNPVPYPIPNRLLPQREEWVSYPWPSGLVSRSWFTRQDYTSTLTPTQPSP